MRQEYRTIVLRIIGISLLMVSASAAIAADPWEAPNVWNTGFSGVFLLLVPIAARFIFLRPKLELSFSHDSGDAVHGVKSYNSNGELKKIQSWYRLRVQNLGWVKLVSPRIWCVGMTAGSGKLSGHIPFTTFEMNWSETDRDFQVGCIIPGRYKYRADFCYLDTAIVETDRVTPFKPLELILHRRNQQESIRLLPGLPYDLCIIVSNDNFLVPSHYCHIRITWTNNDVEDGHLHNAQIEIIDQGDLWWAVLRKKLRKFEE